VKDLAAAVGATVALFSVEIQANRFALIPRHGSRRSPAQDDENNVDLLRHREP
jgi:hypothetical protein